MMRPHAVHRRQLEDAQDDRRGRGVHPGAAAARVDAPTASTSRSAPPFTALQADGRLDARLARRGLRAEHARGARRARSPARSRAPMLDRDRRPRRRPRPLRAPPVLRRDRPRAGAEGRRRRSRPACAPILCVGETEEERERGDTERKLRHQVQEGLEKVADRAARRGRRSPTSRSGRSAPGMVATPEQAQEAIAFVRALVGDRDREQAERDARSSTAARVKPDNAAELLALPDVDGALVGGASLDADSFAAIVDAAVEAAAVTACRSRRSCLVVLDGWGLAPTGRATRSRSPTRRSSTSSGQRYPHTTLTACGEAVGLPEGQMGNSEVGHLNLGAGAVVQQDLTRIDEAVERRHAGRERGPAGGAGRRRARAPDRARLRRRRALGLEHLRGADRARRRAAASPDLVVHAFTDGRDTLPDRRRGVPRDGRGLVRRGRRRARRHGHRPLLRDGPRQALGPHPAGLRPARRTARAEHHADTGDDGRARRLRARRDRRVHQRRRRSATRRAIRPGDSRHRLQLPPRPHARDHAARSPSPASTRSTAAAPSRSSATRR